MVWAKLPGGRNSVPAGDFLEWQRRSGKSVLAMNEGLVAVNEVGSGSAAGREAGLRPAVIEI